MQRHIHRLIAVLLLTASCAATDPSQRQIDAIFRPLASSGTPGLAVLVIKHGRKVFEQGYGSPDLRTRTRIDRTTNFRLASFTKQFTAAAIMLLAREGRLSYDDPLTRFFPEFPEYGRAIQVRHLLTHTAGLPDYEYLYEKKFAGTPAEKIPQVEIPQIKDAEVLQLLAQQSAGMFAPGAKWHYSNSGFAVLAMIVEKVSGKPFDEFLHQRIFAPLDMGHSVAYVNGKNVVPHRAFGYRRRNEQWVFADQSDTSAVLGDGGIYSSLRDLARWERALANHTLLSAAEMQPAVVPVQVPGGAQREDGKPVSYGFGWFLDPYNGRARMYHNGETSGFRTTIQRFVNERLTIIILANRTDVEPEALAKRVADLFLIRNAARGRNCEPVGQSG